jgi:serine/threonine protein kinase
MKPNNILVATDERDERAPLKAVITDFGCSVSLALNESTYTGTSKVVKGLARPETFGLTPSYASPEVKHLETK